MGGSIGWEKSRLRFHAPYKNEDARHKAAHRKRACCRVRFRTSGGQPRAYLTIIEIASRQ
jgi:hypothetical protein